MKRRLQEEGYILLTVLKWTALSAVIGVIVGVSTAVFLKVLGWGIQAANGYSWYFFLLPVAFFLSVLLVKYLAPEAEGHGTEKVIQAVHKKSGKINAAVVPVKLFSTVLTIASGGSAGKEGPCAQIGGGLASMFADIFHINDVDRKKLVICGISAGFASVFGTPIAGAIFGVEVLFIGSILYDVLLPSFMAGIISYHVSAGLGVKYFYHNLNFMPTFSQAFFLKVMAAGVFFGVCSFLFIEILNLGKKLAKRLKMPVLMKAVLGGAALIILTLLFSTKYLGLGLETIEGALNGQLIAPEASFLKAVFTSITLNFGGSGGVITPIFFVGTTAGNIFASIFHLDVAAFSALGMVSLLAGAANTPIAASIMAIELFGPQVGSYAAIACVISFFVSGHRSVYPSQVLAFRKSKLVEVETGRRIDETKVHFVKEQKD